MKKVALVILVALICFAFSTSLVKEISPNIKPTSIAPVKFNMVLFEELVHQKLAGKVKGYSLVLGDKSGIKAKVSGGWAQIPGDGKVPMKTTVASGIGSNFKTVSATALLNIFSRHIHSEKSVKEQLRMKIINQFPPKWKKEFNGTGIERIRYIDLLTHQSGINLDSMAVVKAKRAGYSYEKGFYHFLNMSFAFDKKDIGRVRDYENTNIGLLIWLIPTLAYPNQVKKINDKYSHLKNPKKYSQKMLPEYAALYEKYIRAHIFDRVSPKMKPLFKPGKKSGYAKSYNSKNESSVIDEKYAHAQGGWMVTAQDYANFVRTFYFTNTFFGPKTRASLYVDDTEDSRNDMMIFSSHRYDDRFSDKTNYYPGHNGAEEDYRAVFSMLPFNHYAIVMVNSEIKERTSDGLKDVTNTTLKDILFDAYFEATRGKPISLAKNGLSEGKYDVMAKDLGKNGSRVYWADFYDVKGKVFVNAIFHPAKNKNYTVRHDLSTKAYQKVIDDFWPKGFRPTQIDSYLKGGKIRYAIIMEKKSGEYEANHGLSQRELSSKISTAKSKGLVPVTISGVSIGNTITYACSFKKSNKKNWEVKPKVSASKFKKTIDNMGKSGMTPTSINAFKHKGEYFYTIIFKKNSKRYAYTFGKGPIKYNKAFRDRIDEGYYLKMVTGYGEGEKHRFSGVWWK